MVNRLIEGGYIVCTNPQSRDKFYCATKKPFNASELYKLPSSKSQRIHGRCNIIQIQKSSFITKVAGPPNGDVKWDKEWECNGVFHKLYSYPFSNIGTVRFQRITGKESDQLKIILPRLIWERDNGNPEKFLLELAGRCGTWFMKHFGMELLGLDVCQRPDYALALDDPGLVDMAQRATYRNDDLMIDSSAPDNIPEIESKRWDVIDGLASAPMRIGVLEGKMNSLEEGFGRIEVSLSRIENMFSQPNKVDNSEGMFR